MEQQKCAERREETNVRNVQPEIIKLCYNVAKHCYKTHLSPVFRASADKRPPFVNGIGKSRAKPNQIVSCTYRTSAQS